MPRTAAVIVLSAALTATAHADTRGTPSVDFAAMPETDTNPDTIEIPAAIGRDEDGNIIIAGSIQDSTLFSNTAAVFPDFNFTGPNSVVPLMPPNSNFSSFSAEHISQNGDTIAGFGLTENFGLFPLVWHNPLLPADVLPLPDGANSASPDGMSKDGNAIVGGAFGPSDSPAVSWNESDAFAPMPLDCPPGATNGAIAFDATVMNGDTYTVGAAFDASFNQTPTLWNGTSVAEQLDFGASVGAAANAVTDDLSYIGGQTIDQTFCPHPAIWEDGNADQADFSIIRPELPDGLESGSFDDVDLADLSQFRGAPALVATGSATDDAGQNHAIIFTMQDGIRKLADVITGELAGSIAPFTALTAVNDMKSDPEGGVLAVGMGDTPDGQRGWALRIPPSSAAGPCNPADLADPLGLLDLADVTAFAAAFLAGDPLADIDNSTLLDLADINLFVTAFLAGCP